MDVRIGGVTKAELLRRLADASVSLNEYARVLFADPSFTTAAQPRLLQVVSVSLPEIGLPAGGRYDQIIGHARSIGLELCPLETAPHLRLQHRNQPTGPYLTVASAKLRDDDAHPNGFYLRTLEDGLWLRGYNAPPDVVYAPDFSRFLFAARQ